MNRFGSLVSLFAIFAAGCSAGAEGSEAAGGETEGALAAPVPTGTFKLYPLGAERPNPGCDVHTALVLGAGKATLEERVDGFCELYVAPNARTYPVKVKDIGCGSKSYEGKRRVRFSAVGPDSANFATVKITDHRARTCRDRVMGPIVVEETVPGFPDAITTTLRALEAAPATRTVKGTFVRTMGIGGENTGYSIQTEGKTLELVLDALQKDALADVEDGRVLRVIGGDVTLTGIETGARAALGAQSLLVCLAPGSWINLMPGPGRGPQTGPAPAPTSLTRDIPWELENCPDVNAAY